MVNFEALNKAERNRRKSRRASTAGKAGGKKRRASMSGGLSSRKQIKRKWKNVKINCLRDLMKYAVFAFFIEAFFIA
jgi:hypothetical protein